MWELISQGKKFITQLPERERERWREKRERVREKRGGREREERVRDKREREFVCLFVWFLNVLVNY